jgi:DNA ligase-1
MSRGPASVHEIVEVSQAVRATSGRLEKRARLAEYFARLAPADLRLAASYLSGEIPQGAIQVGGRALQDAMAQPPPAQASLFETPPPSAAPSLADLDAVFEQLQRALGAGSARRRAEILARFLQRLHPDERTFVQNLVLGELRQGALRALVLEGLARAFALEAPVLQRALMFAGSFDLLVTTLARDGGAGLAAFQLEPLVPVEPMLAGTAASFEAALAVFGRAAVEWKLDGVRVQIHRDGDRVQVFSRQLRDVTPLVPEAVDLARRLAARRVILDAEVVAHDAGGRPIPFQDLMSRFSRAESDAPVQIVCFDLLLLDDDVLVDRPYAERRAALERLVPQAGLVRQDVVEDAVAAQASYDAALAAGYEGVMLKSLDAPYTAGRRGSQWLKMKPAVTVDLVILAAEWGHGRRRGWLSNLHLGAPADGGTRFAMLGKTFKGLTDEMLQALTDDLLQLETHHDEHTVYVRPERVVEIAFDSVQRSPRYDSGLALRFARVKRFRPDKSAAQATTLAEIQALHAGPSH